MPEVVVGQCHGGWEPHNDGFARVPSGTTVYLFMDSLRTMWSEDADRATLASAEHIRSLQGKASQTYEGGASFANYSTTDLDADDEVTQGPAQQDVEIVRGGRTIQDIMDQYPSSNIYWFACQALEMKNELADDERPSDLLQDNDDHDGQLNVMQERPDL